MSKVRDLRERREALQTQLDVLRKQRDAAFQANSFALTRERYGAAQQNAAEMKVLANAQVAGDPAMTDLRHHILAIDDELDRDHGRGLAAAGRRAMIWLRK
jgi:hypothetical protein